MAAQFVKPFRKGAAAKNDRNDAEAIATAARQGNMRFVAVKTLEQQARLAWHRAREGYKTEGLALSNRIRGLLAEFGVAVPSELPAELKELLHDIEARGLRCAHTWWPAITALPRMARPMRVVSRYANWSASAR